jgi:6,7-dimethyl-8-ribityllumazine synthase
VRLLTLDLSEPSKTTRHDCRMPPARDLTHTRPVLTLFAYIDGFFCGEEIPMQTLEGALQARDRSFALVVSRFNGLVSQRLLEGALDCLRRHGADDRRLTVVRCPGAFEIPQVALRLAATKSFNAIICLGCVIRGETPHFDYVASEAAKGIAQVAMQTGVPVAFGVLTTDSLAQALERAGAKSGNKGWDAALTALELADLHQQLSDGAGSTRG